MVLSAGALVVAAVLASATAAGGTTAPCGRSIRLATGWLPSQGLVIARTHGVLLVGLDGHVFGSLAGFKLAPQSDDLLLDGLARLPPGRATSHRSRCSSVRTAKPGRS